MTIQEYKEKIIELIEQMESEHDMRVKELRVETNKYWPCWSLAALLDVLPFPQLSKDKLGSGKVGWMVSVYPDNCRYDSCWHDNPIDACVEMIIKLYEKKLL